MLAQRLAQSSRQRLYEWGRKHPKKHAVLIGKGSLILLQGGSHLTNTRETQMRPVHKVRRLRRERRSRAATNVVFSMEKVVVMRVGHLDCVEAFEDLWRILGEA